MKMWANHIVINLSNHSSSSSSSSCFLLRPSIISFCVTAVIFPFQSVNYFLLRHCGHISFSLLPQQLLGYNSSFHSSILFSFTILLLEWKSEACGLENPENWAARVIHGPKFFWSFKGLFFFRCQKFYCFFCAFKWCVLYLYFTFYLVYWFGLRDILNLENQVRLFLKWSVNKMNFFFFK